jgi:RNA polymerase sigma-70 factor, ECF subfamily
MTAQRADELATSDAPLIGTPEERVLALEFQRGERDAYEAIHERYEARVRSVCRRMLSDPDDAQEAAQEAFLRVYQGLPRFNGRYRLGAWIVRITTNVCLDQLRARSRRPADPVPRELLDLESPLAEDTDPQILFLRHAEGRRVRKVLDSLPPLHRAAIVLRDFEGIAYADIAETLGITEGQVKALLHRARKGFKRSWAANMASMLLPAGMFKRFFKPWELPSQASGNAATVSQATETALSASGQFAATAAQAVSACGGALHQCSQFMSDKAAPVLAAAVVGTATVGAAVVSSKSDDRPAVTHDERPLEVVTVAENTEPRVQAIPKSNLIEERAPGEVEEAPAAPPAPEASPAPAPEETPGAPPADEGDPDTPADEGEPATPPDVVDPPAPPPVVPVEPEGFEFTFGLDMASSELPCSCLQETEVLSSSANVSEYGLRSVKQLITGSASAAGTASHGLWLQHLSSTGYDHSMDFTLQTSQGTYTYAANGFIVERSPTEWGGWVYKYEGRYELSGRPTMVEAMPEEGSYSLELIASWRQPRIVKAGFFLTEEKP